MIAVDTNILVYAHRRDSEWHKPARVLIAGLAEGSAPWAVPWPCIHEFLAIVTHTRIYRPPTPVAQALQQVDTWLKSPSLALVAEMQGHWNELRTLALAGRLTGGAFHDARIAAICREHGVQELWSADRDFSRFSGFKVRNPLI